MPDLRCQCGHKIAEYNDTEVRIMDKKCKSITILRVCDGKLNKFSSMCDYYKYQLGKCVDESHCGDCVCNLTAMDKKLKNAFV